MVSTEVPDRTKMGLESFLFKYFALFKGTVGESLSIDHRKRLDLLYVFILSRE